MTTRADMLAAVLATAQALAEHPDCPTLPDLYVVSRGEAAYRCGHCDTALSQADADSETCPHPFCDGEGWSVDQHWPDAVRLADLTSGANGGALQCRLAKRCTLLAVCYVEPHKSHDNGGWHVTADQQKTQRAEHFAHAMALAWLAATPSTSTGETP